VSNQKLHGFRVPELTSSTECWNSGTTSIIYQFSHFSCKRQCFTGYSQCAALVFKLSFQWPWATAAFLGCHYTMTNDYELTIPSRDPWIV